MPTFAWNLLPPLLAQGGAAPGGGATVLDLIPLILMIGAVFYFMVLQPMNKNRNVQESMQKELKKNDRIVTIGGIHGVVTNAANNDEVTIRIDDKTDTKIRITRSAIQKVVTKNSVGDDE